ncbi:MAG: alanine racemase [Actinomycetota bacterium]|nr:alanine racemase [Actinomycetota bacterium]
MHASEIPTPAPVIDRRTFDANLDIMTAARPGAGLRPHVKAHKCTAIAMAQHDRGHVGFTCATPREVLGMAHAGLGADLLLANETVDGRRLAAMAALQDEASITVAVDSEATLCAAMAAGIRRCVIDIDVGLPRCGCPPTDAGHLADTARAGGLEVRGVMGYEGHLMMVTDRAQRRQQVADSMVLLRQAHEDVGGDIVSAGGTGTYDLHDETGITELQAGSYALMDTQYAALGLPFGQALTIQGTVIAVKDGYAVADVGLKALGMDHGLPQVAIDGVDVWFCSDEHITFGTGPVQLTVGGPVPVLPAHVDPTMAMHALAYVLDGDDVVDEWPIDLRGWD